MKLPFGSTVSNSADSDVRLKQYTPAKCRSRALSDSSDNHCLFSVVFTASLPNNRTTGILHGEAYPIAAASILARLSPQSITIYSDHLNSIRLLTSHPSALSLKNNPALSLYRWILNIWDSMPRPPLLSHVRAHTSSLTIPSQLNRHA